MKTSGMIVILVTLILRSLSVGNGIEILTPDSDVSIRSNELTIVGKTSAPLVEVFINNQQYYYGRVFDSIFHVNVKFGYGLNKIKINPIYSGLTVSEFDNAKIEILCQPFSNSKHNNIYPSYNFHNSSNSEQCYKCHIIKTTETFEHAEDSLCLSCHVEYLNDYKTNQILGHNKCNSCHSHSHNEESSLIIGDKAADKCFSCHPGKIEKFNKEYIHGPVAGGSCVVCHSPHGSRFDHSLINAEEILCFSCHDFQQEFKEWPVQHTPFRDGQCGACHDPHATSNKWVLVKSSEVLCIECHGKQENFLKNHGHPYNVKPKKHISNNVKLSDEGKLECLSCHLPHASKSAHLLRSEQRNACLGCHKEMQ
jgi:predicted CXXCH cytochrome family protein